MGVWAGLIGLPAARAICPLQRAVLRSAAVTIILLVLVGIASPVVGAMGRNQLGVLGWFGVIVATGGAVVLVFVSFSFGRLVAAESKIGMQVAVLGGPKRVSSH